MQCDTDINKHKLKHYLSYKLKLYKLKLRLVIFVIKVFCSWENVNVYFVENEVFLLKFPYNCILLIKKAKLFFCFLSLTEPS